MFDGREVFAHASIGIAFADSTTSGDLGAEQLLRNADLAMYIAKEQGKAQWRIFETEMHQAVYDRLELKNDLELAIERGELSLHYQPIVRLATGVPSGFEALLRWHHPTRGNVPPLDFIPLAEETGLIVQIGRRVLQAACHDGVRLNAAMGGRGTIRVGVNLSARQLQRPELIDEVRGALAASRLPPELLVLELTESVMMRDIDLSTRRLGELKELGVLLALDDFGTGYSSLNYIQRFPIDILKIDKSFTDHLGHGRDGRLTEAIVGLANALELVQIAEGIEQPKPGRPPPRARLRARPGLPLQPRSPDHQGPRPMRHQAPHRHPTSRVREQANDKSLRDATSRENPRKRQELRDATSRAEPAERQDLRDATGRVREQPQTCQSGDVTVARSAGRGDRVTTPAALMPEPRTQRLSQPRQTRHTRQSHKRSCSDPRLQVAHYKIAGQETLSDDRKRSTPEGEHAQRDVRNGRVPKSARMCGGPYFKSPRPTATKR